MVTKTTTTTGTGTDSTNDQDVQQAARQIVQANREELNPAAQALKEQAFGHMARKAFDVTGKAMGWIGGIYAIGSGIVLYRNRNRIEGAGNNAGGR
jgi:hypothetical protein